MLRLGLIGAGRWGKVYIRTIEGMGGRVRLTQTAVSRPKNGWKQLVSSPETDAVIIATPAPLHAEMTRVCLEAGKPCVVEKPLCFDIETAKALQQKADQAGLAVLVSYTHLYHPAYQALKRAVAGSGRAIRAVLTEGMDLGPFRPDTGTLWDRCPHDVAICLDLLGGGAEASALGGVPDPRGEPEMVTLNLRWKSGASAWIQSGRLSAQKKRTVSVLTDSELFHLDEQGPVRCRRIPFDYAGRLRLDSAPLPKEGEPIPIPERTAPMEKMLAAFADLVEKKGRPSPGLEFTVELTRILEQCQRALSS